MTADLIDGRYQVDRVLGRGGVATVWRGRDLRLDRPVAVKVLAPAGFSDPAVLDRFQREARTIARLTHPNVVAVHDFGRDEEVPYLVLELVDGASVADLLADGPLPISQAVEIAAQTCDALAAAHAAGVVHRDIKPANLLLTPVGTVKVCDFGIAHLQHSAGHQTLTGPTTAVGTSEYMAPEQVAGDRVDARTDLYALGCVLYGMLTGRPPFTGDKPLGVVYQHLHQEPVRPRVLRSDTPAELDELVCQLLSKEPAQRPASAAEVRARLLALLAAGPTASSGPLAGLASGSLPPAGPSRAARHAAPTGPDAVPVPATASPPTTVAPAVRPDAIGRAPLPTHTMTMPVLAADELDAPAPTGRSWLRPVVIGGGLVVLVMLVVLAVGLATGGSGQKQSALPGGSTPASLPAAASSPAQPPADPLAALTAAVEQQVQAGQLSPEVGRGLGRDLDEIGRRIRKGDRQQAAERLAEFRRRLAELAKDGKLSSAGLAELTPLLDQLAGTLPAVRSDR